MDRHTEFDQDQVSIIVDNHHQEIVAAAADSECESSNPDVEKLKFFTRNGMIRLDKVKKEHIVIKESFLMGMGLLRKESDVIAIHKNLSSSRTRMVRMEAFRFFLAAVAEKCGGDTNVKYAWYGGSRDELCEIIGYGFSRSEEPQNGVSHGVGINLSPTNAALDSFQVHQLFVRFLRPTSYGTCTVLFCVSREGGPSYDAIVGFSKGAMLAEEDEYRLRNMLMCRVILG